MKLDTEIRSAHASNESVAGLDAETLASPRRVFSDQLIGPTREVLIRHAGCDYRLRITRQGKLILTK